MAESYFKLKPVKQLFLETPVSRDCAVLLTMTSAVKLVDECYLSNKLKNKRALSNELKGMNVSST